MKSEIVLTTTPMRIGLLGGGSDLPLFTESGNGPGCVISATIDKYVTIMAKRRFDSHIIFYYQRGENVLEIDDIDNAYAREALKYVKWQGGIEIVVGSDVPAGTGLGGSSAFLVGMLHALCALQGSAIVAEELAEQAFQIETGPLGKQIGRQDHWAAAFGGFRRYDFMPGGRVEESLLGDLSWLSGQALLFYTDHSHPGNEVFADIHQESRKEQNIFLYGVLADMARKGSFFAEKGCWERFWALFEDAWQTKRMTSSMISNHDIDILIAIVRDAGAQQVKICGTGGGGYLFCWCPEGRDIVLMRMIDAGHQPQALPFRFVSHGSMLLFKEDRQC